MVKKAILLLSAAACLGTTAQAQVCGTDYQQQLYRQMHPEIAQYEAELQRQMDEQLRRMDWRKLAKTTNFHDTAQIIIPVAVHVIHGYGSDYVADNDIYRMIDGMNEYYNKRNADTANVIAPFKKWIGNARITFKLAKRDPQGQPTHGITRRFSYLANGGDDQAKFDIWAPDSYFNIWIETRIGRGADQGIVLAYATFPATGAAIPYIDGVIAGYQYINDLTHTMAHEAGHYLNLNHTWASSGQGAGTACGDDGVDDTPPTKGHFSTCPLYDTTCATGYVKTYDPETAYLLFGDSTMTTVDYPDTTNVQNIMDYSSCTNMFTKGQVYRMRSALNSTVGNRNKLWSPTNLANTGVLEPWPDLAPIADFSVNRHFYCANGTNAFVFTNRSWQDTVVGLQWTFGNGATNPNPTTNTVTTGFTQPGWVDVSLQATGNNTGSSTVTKQLVYAADPNATPASGYYQEFSDPNALGNWPIFNYFDTKHRWEVVQNAGFYDNTSIRFTNVDTRIQYPDYMLGTPQGDYADFFTPAFDLSSSEFATNANLNFMSAGAFRTTDPNHMNDVLEVSYSVDCGQSFVNLPAGVINKANLGNNGTVNHFFIPGYMGEWRLQSLPIPTSARTPRTFFRFRFKPGVNTATLVGSGNNFYIDRINISSFPTGISEDALNNQEMEIAPNPTTGSSFVILKGGNNRQAQITVTDLAGKVVYRTEANLNDKISRIEIPASAIAVKGMYLVQVVSGSHTTTKKLVSY